jgi:hypothetical protein
MYSDVLTYDILKQTKSNKLKILDLSNTKTVHDINFLNSFTSLTINDKCKFRQTGLMNQTQLDTLTCVVNPYYYNINNLIKLKQLTICECGKYRTFLNIHDNNLNITIRSCKYELPNGCMGYNQGGRTIYI